MLPSLLVPKEGMINNIHQSFRQYHPVPKGLRTWSIWLMSFLEKQIKNKNKNIRIKTWSKAKDFQLRTRLISRYVPMCFCKELFVNSNSGGNLNKRPTSWGTFPFETVVCTIDDSKKTEVSNWRRYVSHIWFLYFYIFFYLEWFIEYIFFFGDFIVFYFYFY
jgi:hypothetical protein